MNKNVFIIVCSITATVIGFGLILAADHLGWLAPSDEPTAVVHADLCRHQLEVDKCPFCTPALVEAMGMCAGHNVPEAFCTRCNKSLIPAFKTEQDWCREHNVPESQCLLCDGTASGKDELLAQPVVLTKNASSKQSMRVNREPSATCSNAFSTVQLQTPDIAQQAGLQVEPIQTQTIQETVTCNATVAYDGNHYAHLASRASGIIAEVLVDLGTEVQKGDILAIVDSAELGSAKAAYLQAKSLVDLWQKNFAREQDLYEKNVGTEKDVLEAETKLVESRVQLSSSRQRLKNLGLSEEEIDHVAKTNDASSYLPLRAPFAGIIAERNAAIGEVLSESQPLFAIADMDTMWVLLDVYENEVSRLKTGSSVTLTIDAMPEQRFEGKLTWISSHVNPKTRTIQARAEVQNVNRLLRANMFGRATVHIQTIENAVLVPETAVQWDGCCNIVFVRHTDTIYQPYKVTLGYKQGPYYLVKSSLPANESVVTQGSFLLKTEILKGNIGAGCCEVDPGASK